MTCFAHVLSCAFDQECRLLGLGFPHDDPPTTRDSHGRQRSPALAIERLEAEEGLSRDHSYTLTLLADSAGIALQDMLGKPLAVSLVRPDGSLRGFTGHVFAFELTGSAAGVAGERITQPWTSKLESLARAALASYPAMMKNEGGA